MRDITHTTIVRCFAALITLSVLSLVLSACLSTATPSSSTGSLVIAFPISDTQLRVVFSEPVDRASAGRAENYAAESGLKIVAASVDPNDPKRVTLTAGTMDGKAMKVDMVRATGVRTLSGATLVKNESPRFIQGIASIPETMKPGTQAFPFASRFVGLVASESCGKDGGVDSNKLIDVLGFAFIHEEAGGLFSSIKVVTQRHIPGISEAVAKLQEGQSVHVLWAGGEVRNVDGETQLVDTGFMEGSIIEPPLKSPPAYLIKTVEISKEAGRTPKAQGLQGVVVRFDNVTIDSISAPNERKLRSFVFHDESGAKALGLLLDTVTLKLEAGQKFQSLRGLAHQPRPGEYEVIVEMDQHLSTK